MRKLTKTEYKKLIKAKALLTGPFKGRLVTDAEDDSELYYHLQDIRHDYKKGSFTLINADAEMANNFLKFTDDDFMADIDDLYGSQEENLKDLKLFLNT